MSCERENSLITMNKEELMFSYFPSLIPAHTDSQVYHKGWETTVLNDIYCSRSQGWTGDSHGSCVLTNLSSQESIFRNCLHENMLL